MSILDRPTFQHEVHERFPDIPWLTPKPVICPKCGTELTEATRLPPRKNGRKGDCRVCHERGKRAQDAHRAKSGRGTGETP